MLVSFASQFVSLTSSLDRERNDTHFLLALRAAPMLETSKVLVMATNILFSFAYSYLVSPTPNAFPYVLETLSLFVLRFSVEDGCHFFCIFKRRRYLRLIFFCSVSSGIHSAPASTCATTERDRALSISFSPRKPSSRILVLKTWSI